MAHPAWTHRCTPHGRGGPWRRTRPATPPAGRPATPPPPTAAAPPPPRPPGPRGPQTPSHPSPGPFRLLLRTPRTGTLTPRRWTPPRPPTRRRTPVRREPATPVRSRPDRHPRRTAAERPGAPRQHG